MATLNPTNATQAVHHAAVQLAALDWIDQDAARQLSPRAEAVANMFMVLYYQAETGQATRDDFRQALDAVRQSLHVA
ncbi:type I toxin-antitoxin system ptaRNA1 family toxin [Diaphorobacter sp.]|uniref:type I toxin-antitoxin system ptaRNA1 family toxin n=1 Tax=Diaphorobacter sp. TaxID=1934310 RepID=UPI0028AC21A7|nr:type I toxin-antitoxin system ptaRNA1 family toxin [Diaphorobacter sp.]